MSLNLGGCYREVVSAKGPGAAVYNDQIRNAHNYSGLSFDDPINPPQKIMPVGVARPAPPQ